MATKVMMKHKESALLKEGFIGFSWTTFFFGAFPALFRGDFMTFFGIFAFLLILAVVTAGVGSLLVMIIWAFKYNQYYTKKLIEKGYVLSDTPENNALAAQALQMAV